MSDVYIFLREGFRDILQELMETELDAALEYEYQRDITGIEEKVMEGEIL